MTIEGEPFQVHGVSWMDHEFGTTFLEKYQQGWDWSRCSSRTGPTSMLFELIGVTARLIRPFERHTRPVAGNSSVLIRRLHADAGTALDLTRDGGAYPVEWQVRLPSEKLDLAIRPVLAMVRTRRRPHGNPGPRKAPSTSREPGRRRFAARLRRVDRYCGGALGGHLR